MIVNGWGDKTFTELSYSFCRSLEKSFNLTPMVINTPNDEYLPIKGSTRPLALGTFRGQKVNYSFSEIPRKESLEGKFDYNHLFVESDQSNRNRAWLQRILVKFLSSRRKDSLRYIGKSSKILPKIKKQGKEYPLNEQHSVFEIVSQFENQHKKMAVSEDELFGWRVGYSGHS
jgi:hypothetical protein